MGWEEELFAALDDLEQQAEALFDAEREAELADRARAEYGAVTLASRLMASVGGASPRSVPEVAWSPLTRLGLGSALRRLADAGKRCVVHQRDGTRHEGRVLRVGADFAEVGVAPDRVELVGFGTLAAVQSRE